MFSLTSTIQFKSQVGKSIFSWCEKYRYDFYIPSINCIIETHGKQHYEESPRGRSLSEEEKNDYNKQKIALENGMKFIVIDCRKSNREFIKKSIYKSEMKKLFDLSKVNWFKCEEFATNNLVKIACDIWNNAYTTTEIISKMGLSRSTIIRYLKLDMN